MAPPRGNEELGTLLSYRQHPYRPAAPHSRAVVHSARFTRVLMSQLRPGACSCGVHTPMGTWQRAGRAARLAEAALQRATRPVCHEWPCGSAPYTTTLTHGCRYEGLRNGLRRAAAESRPLSQREGSLQRRAASGRLPLAAVAFSGQECTADHCPRPGKPLFQPPFRSFPHDKRAPTVCLRVPVAAGPHNACACLAAPAGRRQLPSATRRRRRTRRARVPVRAVRVRAMHTPCTPLAATLFLARQPCHPPSLPPQSLTPLTLQPTRSQQYSDPNNRTQQC
jgi:hypothetical protein